MMAQHVPPSGGVTIWPRTAIHDTVAAIVKQRAYRRDVARTLLDRILDWLSDIFVRVVNAIGEIPHGRAIATIAFAIVVVLILARVLYSGRLRTSEEDQTLFGRGVSTSSTDPWRDAEMLAANGQFTEAAHALYRAALAMLAVKGLVRLHESKTSGDYARELRRRGAPVHAPFRRFGARYDRIIYGAGECDAMQYAALLDDARALAIVRDSERAA
jgi:hypothetical protein